MEKPIAITINIERIVVYIGNPLKLHRQQSTVYSADEPIFEHLCNGRRNRRPSSRHQKI